MTEPRTLEALASELGMWATELVGSISDLERAVHSDRSRVARVLSGRVFEGAPSDRLTRDLFVVRCGRPEIDNAVFATLVEVGGRHAARRPVLEVSDEAREMVTAALEHLSSRPKGFLRSRGSADERADAVVTLARLHDWAERTGFGTALASAAALSYDAYLPSTVADGLDSIAESLGVAPRSEVAVLAAPDVSTLSKAWSAGRDLTTTLDALREDVRDRFATVRNEAVRRQLASIDIEVLKQLLPPGARLQAARDAGAHTVADVLALETHVHAIPGLGHETARALRAAALDAQRTLEQEAGSRFDADPGDLAVTALIRALWRLQTLHDTTAAIGDALEELARDIEPIGPALGTGEDVVLLHRTSPRRGQDVVRYLRERASWLREVGLDGLQSGPTSTVADDVVWDDYRKRAVLYQGLLRGVLGLEDDVEALRGGLPTEIGEAVERQRLDTAALSPDLQASLRGYQVFGAKYALAQRRVLIGDEMGLGKTIQALAVMSHLHAQDARRFLVVCPPPVLVNWMREIRQHSSLMGHRLHGPERDHAARRWRALGGVAVTSFDTLRRLDLGEEDLDLLVVDEAHLVKNPTAKRTASVAEVGERSGRVLFLTGTPLENKVEDFTNLLGMLQPELVEDLDPALMVVGARGFREQVAPGYLRRRSEDVATELPDLVRTDEWVSMTDAEREEYFDAVARGDFHSARRAAFTADPSTSSKLERLEDIVKEAASNGRNVLVFSFYLDVIDAVVARLGDRVVGTITGQTPADSRQAVADRLAQSRVPRVLVSQISAGGVGMNIQAASVVILCEPQVKPSTEQQALKRAHRMGQLNSVQVHRLVSEESVDERMLEILQQKLDLIDTYVDTSEVAKASASATDVNEARLVRDVMAQEQRRQAARAAARMSTALAGLPVDGQPTHVSSSQQATPPTPSERVKEPTTRQASHGLPRPATNPARLCTNCGVVSLDGSVCGCGRAENAGRGL
ncbi:DEAD/DEAH box helicase [Nocardioides currus]|nr:DEAD/DEAH box helicase [Nocardioides currus]